MFLYLLYGYIFISKGNAGRNNTNRTGLLLNRYLAVLVTQADIDLSPSLEIH